MQSKRNALNNDLLKILFNLEIDIIKIIRLKALELCNKCPIDDKLLRFWVTTKK